MNTLNKLEEKISEKMNKRPLIVAGPCSVESEQQLLRTAIELASSGRVDVLRAGVWKPRTNPGGFEGLGAKCLPWLLKAKQLTGLPTAVEVATPKHVEDALIFETDVLWIGARTSTNPFSVQALADALRGSKVPVWVKNPVNPDAKLWAGAVERLLKAGIENISLIHRGFSVFGTKEYRNAPLWQVPIEMKRLFPEMKLICDPSHISGKRKGILELAQKAAALDYDGLMIESHYQPDSALTDKEQQLTPQDLLLLLDAVSWKKRDLADRSAQAQLAMAREKIDLLDEELLSLLAQRMRVSQEIGNLKKEHQLTVLQSNRFAEILQKMQGKARPLGLSEDFVERYMDAVHLESIRQQNSLLQGSDTRI